MLDKAIKYGKEHRKNYYGTKAIDCSCRNHGTCIHCYNNRMYSTIKRKNKIEFSLKEYLTN